MSLEDHVRVERNIRYSTDNHINSQMIYLTLTEELTTISLKARLIIYVHQMRFTFSDEFLRYSILRIQIDQELKVCYKIGRSISGPI